MTLISLALSMTQSLEALRLASSNMDQGLLISGGGFDNIMLHAMGKVGSTSMMMSLGADYVPRIRELYPPIMKTHEDIVARDYMQKLSPGKKTLVIGLVRNPFAQQESLFFEHIIDGLYHDLNWEQAQQMSVAQLAEEFPKHVAPSEYQDYWRSVTEYTGVDVTGERFDFGGHKLLAHNEATNVSVLVLRLEDADQWQEIMQQHIPKFVLKVGQVGSKRPYKDKYAAFRNSYIFPPSAIQTIQSHDSYRFYTKEEQELFESLASDPAHLQDRIDEPMEADPEYVAVGSHKLFMGDLDDMGEEFKSV